MLHFSSLICTSSGARHHLHLCVAAAGVRSRPPDPRTLSRGPKECRVFPRVGCRKYLGHQALRPQPPVESQVIGPVLLALFLCQVIRASHIHPMFSLHRHLFQLPLHLFNCLGNAEGFLFQWGAESCVAAIQLVVLLVDIFCQLENGSHQSRCSSQQGCSTKWSVIVVRLFQRVEASVCICAVWLAVGNSFIQSFKSSFSFALSAGLHWAKIVHSQHSFLCMQRPGKSQTG